jgi:hypothetical protein
MWIILPVAISTLLGERQGGSVEDLLDERVRRSIVDDDVDRRSVVLPLPALNVASVFEELPHRGVCYWTWWPTSEKVRPSHQTPYTTRHRMAFGCAFGIAL